MRKFLYGLGVVTFGLILLVAGGLLVLNHELAPLDAQSQAYVDRVVPRIIGHWNPGQLLARASPTLRASARPGQLVGLFQVFSELGPMTAYEGAKGGANVVTGTGSGTVVSATYVAHARFHAGTATIRIALVRLHGHWRISAFFVHPRLTGPPDRAA